jgi:hypothetical protein
MAAAPLPTVSTYVVGAVVGAGVAAIVAGGAVTGGSDATVGGGDAVVEALRLM